MNPSDGEIQKEIYLKNMVSSSCIRLIRLVLTTKFSSLKVENCELGKVNIRYNPKEVNFIEVEKVLEEQGFEKIETEDERIVASIKKAAIEWVFLALNNIPLTQNSEYFSAKLQMPYYKLSKIFSNYTDSTLEKYMIALKMEKAKQLILTGEYTMSEIALILNYNSVQYLGNQFKKSTGVTMSDYKKNPTPPIVLEKL